MGGLQYIVEHGQTGYVVPPDDPDQWVEIIVSLINNPELREKIFRNMSERATEIIKEEMEYMGPVRLSDVEAAQQSIVDVVRRLEEAGEVIIQGRGEGEIIV